MSSTKRPHVFNGNALCHVMARQKFVYFFNSDFFESSDPHSVVYSHEYDVWVSCMEYSSWISTVEHRAADGKRFYVVSASSWSRKRVPERQTLHQHGSLSWILSIPPRISLNFGGREKAFFIQDSAMKFKRAAFFALIVMKNFLCGIGNLSWMSYALLEPVDVTVIVMSTKSCRSPTTLTQSQFASFISSIIIAR